MDWQLVKAMAVVAFVVFAITLYIVNNIDKKDKSKINTRFRKQKNNKVLDFVYLFLNSIPPVRGYIAKIRRRYEILYPGKQKEILKRTMQTICLSWGLCAFAIWFILRTSLNLNNSLVAIICALVINTEVIGFLLAFTEIKLLEDIMLFVSNVRHNYYINRMVDDAILLSMEGVSYEMKVHINKLYDIAMSTNLKEDVANYNATVNNKYLKMFLSLCTSVIEYGDKKVNGQLLFAANLENLKKEIDIEVLKQKKLRFLFSGLTFATVGVILPIDAIKNYGVSMMAQMDSFYSGGMGIVYVITTLLITVFIYLLNNRLKESRCINLNNYGYLKRIENIRIVKRALDNYVEKHYGKMQVLKETLKRIGDNISPRQLLLQRILLSVGVFFLSVGFVFYIHENNKINITTKAESMPALAAVVNSSQQKTINEAILQYVNIYKEEEGVTEAGIFNKVNEEGIIYNSKVGETIAKEVASRIFLYQKEFFKWYELIICFGIAVVAFQMPYWMILYRKRVLQMNMEDEVTQFNSIIYMMMFNSHITVKDLLEELELFAVVFKRTLQECINDYSGGDIEALERMKEREGFLPFKRLVDNLIRCDSISIDKAFDEISSDRENYHAKRKQENEISIQRRIDIAKPLSFIPTILVLAYLVLPLIIASMNELKSFSDMMNM